MGNKPISSSPSDDDDADTKRCSKILHRLLFLGNSVQIRKDKMDKLFPQALTTIARDPNATCVAGENGRPDKQCWEYNTWNNFDGIMQERSAWDVLSGMMWRLQDYCIDRHPI